MGAQVSINANNTEKVLQNISKVILQNILTCSTSYTGEQNISFDNVSGNVVISDIKQSNTVSLNTDCLQQTSDNASILQDIKDALQQQAINTNTGQNIGSIQSTNQIQLQKAITNITNNIDLTNVKSCLMETVSKQNISAKNIGGNVYIANIDQSIALNTIQNCLEQSTRTLQYVNDLSSQMSQTSSSTNTGFLTQTSSIIIAIVVLVIIMLVAYYYFSNKSNNKSF